MDTAFKLLFFVHLVALMVGGATNVAMPLIGRQSARATPDSRAGLATIARTLRINALAAVAALVVSGAAMLQIRYGGVGWANGWFWAKMALVALIVVLSASGGVIARLQVNPRVIGMTMRVVLLATVFTAVFAFN